MAQRSKAIDQVRAEKARQAKREGYELIFALRGLFLKRPQHLTAKQVTKLAELFKTDYQRSVWI